VTWSDEQFIEQVRGFLNKPDRTTDEIRTSGATAYIIKCKDGLISLETHKAGHRFVICGNNRSTLDTEMPGISKTAIARAYGMANLAHRRDRSHRPVTKEQTAAQLLLELTESDVVPRNKFLSDLQRNLQHPQWKIDLWHIENRHPDIIVCWVDGYSLECHRTEKAIEYKITWMDNRDASRPRLGHETLRAACNMIASAFINRQRYGRG